MLTNPAIGVPFFIGVVVVPLLLKTLSSMTILIGFHDTWMLFVTSLILSIIFVVLVFFALKPYLNFTLIGKLTKCAFEEGSSSLNPMDALQQNIAGELNNVTQNVSGQLENVSGQLENASQQALATQQATTASIAQNTPTLPTP